MRRNGLSLLIVLGLIVSGGLASCEEEVSTEGFKPSTRLFKVPNDIVYIDANAADGSSLVKASFPVTANCNWSLEYNGWEGLEVSPKIGGVNDTVVTITTPVNENTTEREDSLFFSILGTKIKKKITLKQRGASAALEVEPASLPFGKDGGSTAVAVICNTTWTLTGGTDWCRADKKEGVAGTTTVTITADATNEKDTRTATFSVTPTGSNSSKKITVTQSPKEIKLKVSPTSMTFDANTLKQDTIEIGCNDEWDATVSHNWIKLDGTKISASGTGNATLIVSCEPNNEEKERTGTITVTCSGITQKINVTQYSYNVTFNIDPKAIPEFPEEGGTQTITVTSNTSWTVSGGSDWCHLSTTEGNGSVTITVDANEQTTPRTAYITFMPSGKESQTLTVTQAARHKTIILTVSPTELEFGVGEESRIVTVESNETWTSSVDKGWVAIEKGEQTTSGELTSTKVKLTCAANTTGKERTATFTVKVIADSEQRTATVSITQTTANTPVVENLAVSDTIDCKATLNASYRSTLPVTEYGFVYATHAKPTLDDTKVAFYGSSTSGIMSCTLEKLNLHTRYHVRAYATNASGTAYSDEKEFTANGPQPGQNDNGFPTLNN